jgi:hypothetical protein
MLAVLPNEPRQLIASHRQLLPVTKALILPVNRKTSDWILHERNRAAILFVGNCYIKLHSVPFRM